MSYELVAKLTTHHKVLDLDEVRTALTTLEAATRQEDGCTLFSVKESDQQTGVFYLWEQWKSKDALDEHFEQKHTRHYLSLDYTEVAECHVLHSLSKTDNES